MKAAGSAAAASASAASASGSGGSSAASSSLSTNRDALAEATKQMRARNMKKATGRHAAKGKMTGAKLKARRQTAKISTAIDDDISELRMYVIVIVFSLKISSN